MLLLERQEEYDDEALKIKGLSVIKHHLWYESRAGYSGPAL